jgi:hypothetical protein
VDVLNERGHSFPSVTVRRRRENLLRVVSTTEL